MTKEELIKEALIAYRGEILMRLNAEITLMRSEDIQEKVEKLAMIEEVLKDWNEITRTVRDSLVLARRIITYQLSDLEDEPEETRDVYWEATYKVNQKNLEMINKLLGELKSSDLREV